jgi:hypothetical protein
LQGRLNLNAPGSFKTSLRRAAGFFRSENIVTSKTSVIVMTVVGNEPYGGDPLWNQIDALPAPPGFCWRFVPEGPFPDQFRSILRTGARAVVVWAGANDAVNRATKLIGRLLSAGLPVVIAISEVHDPSTESVLRRAGALYICAHEAQHRLGVVLSSILGPPSRSVEVKTFDPPREVKMDAS